MRAIPIAEWERKRRESAEAKERKTKEAEELKARLSSADGITISLSLDGSAGGDVASPMSSVGSPGASPGGRRFAGGSVSSSRPARMRADSSVVSASSKVHTDEFLEYELLHISKGDFQVHYSIAAPGDFMFDIRLYGQHIQDSPKRITVRHAIR